MFQVPISAGMVQDTLIDPETGQPIGDPSDPAYYAESFYTVSIPSVGAIEESIGNVYYNSLRTLSTVFRGRPKSQTFGQCVANNISATFLNKVNGEKVLSAGSLVVPAVFSGLALIRVPFGQGGSVMLGTAVGARTGQAIGLGAVGATRVAAGFAALSTFYAVDAAATLGVTMGSTAGCVSEGLDE